MTFARGQWVFVDPHAGDAPRELRGLAGQVVALADDRVTVAFGNAPIEVDAAILLADRRRRNRPPAQWPAPPFAQSA